MGRSRRNTPFLVFVLLGGAGCGILGPEVACACSPIPVSISVSPVSATVSVGDSTVISAEVNNPYGTWDAVEWSVSDTTVLSVYRLANFTFVGVGLSAGTATVTAIAGGQTASALVSVVD